MKTEIKLSEFLKSSYNEAMATCGTRIFIFRRKDGKWTMETEETGREGFEREKWHSWFTGKAFGVAVPVDIVAEMKKIYQSKKKCDVVCFHEGNGLVATIDIKWDMGEL